MPATSSVDTGPPPGRRVFAWLTAALLICVGWEALRSNAGGAHFGQFDKLLHFGAFVALSTCSALALGPGRRNALKLVTVWLLYGALIEVVQSFIPGRDPSWLDLMADAAGIAAGLKMAHLLRQLPALQGNV